MQDGPGSNEVCEHSQVGQQDCDRCRAGQEERTEDGNQVRCQTKTKPHFEFIDGVHSDGTELGESSLNPE